METKSMNKIKENSRPTRKRLDELVLIPMMLGLVSIIIISLVYFLFSLSTSSFELEQYYRMGQEELSSYRRNLTINSWGAFAALVIFVLALKYRRRSLYLITIIMCIWVIIRIQSVL